MSVLTLEAKLERTDPSTPWGFRMQGGKDFSSPLSIQRVNPGSLAAKCGLQVGDVILKIGNTSTEILRHKEAQDSIVSAGNRLDLLLQRGGASQFQNFQSNYETFTTPTFNANTLQSSAGGSSSQTFNAAPRPFGAQPSPAPFKAYGTDSLAQKTSNLSLSSGSSNGYTAPKTAASPALSPVASKEPDFRTAAEKYSEHDEPQRPAHLQSRSFKYLQDLMDSGKEPPNALKPSQPKALQPRSHSPVESDSGSQIKLGKPGTVKAIMAQRYNTPIGLYSDTEVMTQYEGQSKFLISSENGGDIDLPPPPPPEPEPEPIHSDEDSGAKVYFPSETYRLVQQQEKGEDDDAEEKRLHSRSFLMLQKQLDRFE